MKKILYCINIVISTALYSATHIVTNTNDNGPGSLRQALLDVNSDGTSPRIIEFAINTGYQTIKPKTELPTIIVDNVLIDGTTQPGWTAGNPQIILDGFIANFRFDGFNIEQTNNCIIQDIVINNGFFHGISAMNSNDVAIYECFLGTDYTGTYTSPNAIGVRIYSDCCGNTATNTIIGGPNKGNVISGNTRIGLFLSGAMENTLIQSNKIGTDITGNKALSNLIAGVAIGILPPDGSLICKDTLIGGALSSQSNLISGNGPSGSGIICGYENFNGLIIEGNTIGMNITGTSPLPNSSNITLIQSVIGTYTNVVIQNNIM